MHKQPGKESAAVMLQLCQAGSDDFFDRLIITNEGWVHTVTTPRRNNEGNSALMRIPHWEKLKTEPPLG